MKLSEQQEEIVRMVHEFTNEEILPRAEHYDAHDEYPAEIVDQLKELGLFSITIPEQYGGLGLDLLTYTLVIEELSRGWVSISGVLNTHFIGSYLLVRYGTEEQKERWLPEMASGQMRAAFSLSEPEAGSDVQAIRTRAVPVEAGWSISGQKMWVTNGLGSSLIFLLALSSDEEKPHQGMSCFVVEKEPWQEDMPGLHIPGKIKKLGYKGVESTELVFDEFLLPGSNLLGGKTGQGFYQMMDALEVGRINVAARGVGLAQRALELAIEYARDRKTFGKPIAKHQAIQFRIAEMATKTEAARQLTRHVARQKDETGRAGIEAGMAKMFASEAAKEVVEDSFRVHGGYGYSTEYEIERLYRDAPLLLVGEGTSDIQKLLIGRNLLDS